MTQGGYRVYVDIPSIQRTQAAHLLIMADTPETVFDIEFVARNNDDEFEADPWEDDARTNGETKN